MITKINIALALSICSVHSFIICIKEVPLPTTHTKEILEVPEKTPSEIALEAHQKELELEKSQKELEERSRAKAAITGHSTPKTGWNLAVSEFKNLSSSQTGLNSSNMRKLSLAGGSTIEEAEAAYNSIKSSLTNIKNIVDLSLNNLDPKNTHVTTVKKIKKTIDTLNGLLKTLNDPIVSIRYNVEDFTSKYPGLSSTGISASEHGFSTMSASRNYSALVEKIETNFSSLLRNISQLDPSLKSLDSWLNG